MEGLRDLPLLIHGLTDSGAHPAVGSGVAGTTGVSRADSSPLCVVTETTQCPDPCRMPAGALGNHRRSAGAQRSV